MLNLDDAMRLLPGIATMRSINAPLLRILLGRKRKECTWCGLLVGKGRSTWCSDPCVTAFQIRCSPNHQRAYIERRDKGICQSCQRDTIQSEKDFKLLGLNWRARQPELAANMLTFGYARGQWREVDHIIPVCLGGGLCREENLRLICGACHKAATDHLARMRKAS